MLAAIDADIITYRAGFAAEKRIYQGHAVNEKGLVDAHPFYYGPGFAEMRKMAKDREFPSFVHSMHIEVEPETNALSNARNMVETCLQQVGATDHYLALSTGTESFRHQLATIADYKANRLDARKPEHYEAIRDYLFEHWGAQVFSSVEADDVVALLLKEYPGLACICSVDKDLLQVPGLHYNFETKKLVEVDALTGLRNLYKQVLTGDTTDNIRGIYRLGKVKAEKLIDHLEEEEEMRSVCLDAWREYFESPKSKGLEHFQHLSPEEAMEEVYQLVLVGGPRAQSALHESGEAKAISPIQVPTGEERSEGLGGKGS